MSEPLEVIAVSCECGTELFRISTNVLGICTTIQCRECKKLNNFNHSLRPEADMGTHLCHEAFPSTNTERSSTQGQK